MSTVHKEKAAEVLANVAAAMPETVQGIIPALDDAMRETGEDNLHLRMKVTRALYDALPPPWNSLPFNLAPNHPNNWRDTGGFAAIVGYFSQASIEDAGAVMTAAAARAEAIAADR